MFHLDGSKVDLVLHMLQWLYTYISSFSFVFKRMLHIFHLYFKGRSGVAPAAMALVAGGERPAAGLRFLPCAFLTRRASPSPSPPFTFLHLAVAARARPERDGELRASNASAGAPSRRMSPSERDGYGTEGAVCVTVGNGCRRASVRTQNASTIIIVPCI
jgi:hypothetical protein